MLRVPRQLAALVCLLTSLLFLAPGPTWASDTESPPAPVPRASLKASLNAASSDPTFSLGNASPAGPVIRSGRLPAWQDKDSPQGSQPSTGGSRWSRLSAAKKTWIIVGIVVGAAGIVALVSGGGSNNKGGGGGGIY
jgi:hypothetical protein